MAGKRTAHKRERAEDTFACKLSMYIEKSGLTIQKLAAVTGLGRTAIQHTLAGKLVPAKSFVDRLCAALPMTPDQRTELSNQYAREKAGDAVYYNRCRIKEIIESLPQYRISETMTRFTMENNDKFPCPVGSVCPVKTVTGIVNVNSLFRTVIITECRTEDPHFTAALPMESMFFEMLPQILSASGRRARLEHYFTMNTCAEGEKNTNMDILQGALKTAMCAAVDYSPYYHYISPETEDNILAPYPYYIVTSEFSLLISADHSSAVMIDSPELREELLRHSERIKSRSSLMIKQVGQPEMFDTFANSAQYFYSSIEYQPCLTGFITEDILLKRLGNVPDRDGILQTVSEKFFSGNKQDSGHFKNFFTKEGLISFAETGQMTNMPGSLLMPMSREERIYFLESMKSAAGSYVMLTKDFAVPSFMQVICLTNRQLIISCLTEEKNFCCLLTEPGLCGAFEDLIDNLTDSGLTESVGILTAVIDCCIDMLKSSEEEYLTD
ncbi:MAG: helix-turn-helix domain-containing protein [Oscillospiraceae bacterium]|nr:helix-turn-helix domain-containing protein [Oscillospiraceae bacterium]